MSDFGVAVLGAGGTIARAIVRDLAESPEVGELLLLDVDGARAAQVFCHRHTLRYRIRRVEELTARSLTSPRDRIEFWLALRGRELAL